MSDNHNPKEAVMVRDIRLPLVYGNRPRIAVYSECPDDHEPGSDCERCDGNGRIVHYHDLRAIALDLYESASTAIKAKQEEDAT